MEPITVPRQKLIATISGNRERHIRAHDKAVKGWRSKQIETVQRASVKAMRNARAGRQVSLVVSLPKPSSYVKQYDRVLGMLRMDTSPTIKLTAQDYDRFVKDEWEWSNEFANSTIGYIKKKVRI
jgi:hypothetical protein